MIKYIIFTDVDGVLNDGQLTIGYKESMYKVFCDLDTRVRKVAKERNIKIYAISRVFDEINKKFVTERLGASYITSKNKAWTVIEICQFESVKPKSCAFIGDDTPDIKAMNLCGNVFVPANYHLQILKEVSNVHICKNQGGNGVLREVFEILEGTIL